MFKKVIVFSILIQPIFVGSVFCSKDDYNKGWEAFLKNNRQEARKYFKLAINDQETAPDALLSLSLINWNENKLDAAFDEFKNSYKLSSNPYPYFYALSSTPLVYDGILSKSKLDFFEKAAADPKTNGTLKAMICERIGNHYINVNNKRKADDIYSKMGNLKNWQVLGTFDNTSGSGFSKDWGAVSRPLEKDTFTNKNQAKVNWYSPVYNKENNWFVFDNYFNIRNAIFYAQSFVQSTSDQEAYLRAGTSGSLKIWVNDALISTIPEERNCDLDIYSYKIKLNKGANRILVQIGTSEIDRANFLIRLTDENANPLSNIISSTGYDTYQKSDEKPQTEPLTFFAEEFFKNQIKSDIKNPLNYILLAETYLHNDKAYEATKTLKTLESLYGKSTVVSYLLYEAYIRAHNQTDYEKELETIKNTDPDSYFSLDSRYDEAIKSEKYNDALDICKKMKELYGASSNTDNWELKLASFQKRYEDLISLAKTLYAKYPDNNEYMQLNYQIKKEVAKDPNAAVALADAYCRSYYNEDAIELLSKACLEIGNSTYGVNILYKQLEKFPYSIEYYQKLINILFDMQSYDKALALTDKALKLAPYNSDIYANRGYIYKNLNQTEKAKENFYKSIYYSPTSYESRTQLRLLDKKKEIFELFPKSELKELISKAGTTKEYPESNSLYILNDYQQVVYPEGAKEYRRELAIKILNKSGIDSWKQYNIGYNGYSQKVTIDKAEVIKSNGNTAKAETNGDDQIVFTNLEVNDVLHIEFRVRDYSFGKLAKNFFDDFLYKRSIPSMVNKYSLLVTTDAKFTYQVASGSIDPEISNVENMKLYKWELDNQPAVKEETYMSAYRDVLPVLRYSSLPDWKYVSDWYKDLTTSKFRSDYVLKETFENLLKGKENLSQLEKAKIFYEYILENITYSSVDFLQSNFIPQKASRTITTRLGDCKDLSTLFVALCREAGINANLVLISTRNTGSLTMPLPTIGFNHCIAQLNVDNKTYYLELTDNALPFASAVNIDLQAQILPIPFSNEAIGDKLINMDMTNRTLNNSTRIYNISFQKNDMILDRNFIYTGAMSSYQRHSFKNIGAEEQLKKKSQAVAKEFSVPTKVTNLKFTNLDNLKDTLTVSYKAEVKNYIQDVAGMKIFKLPWSDTNSLDIVSLEERTYPFEFWSYQTEDVTIEKAIVEIPSGMKLADLPQNLKYECSVAEYRLSFDSRIAGKITVTRYFERKADKVSTKDYAAFRTFINNVSEADGKQYAFK